MVGKGGGRRTWVLATAAAVVILILAYAWIDGGREPLRTIREPLPVPEAAK